MEGTTQFSHRSESLLVQKEDVNFSLPKWLFKKSEKDNFVFISVTHSCLCDPKAIKLPKILLLTEQIFPKSVLIQCRWLPLNFFRVYPKYVAFLITSSHRLPSRLGLAFVMFLVSRWNVNSFPKNKISHLRTQPSICFYATTATRIESFEAYGSRAWDL